MKIPGNMRRFGLRRQVEHLTWFRGININDRLITAILSGVNPPYRASIQINSYLLVGRRGATYPQ